MQGHSVSRFLALALIAAAGQASVYAMSTCTDTPVAGGAPVPTVDNSDPWMAPASYYSAVSGTGAALKSSLQSAMTSGHIQRRYGDFRYSAVLHDADPNNPGNIFLAYNRASIPGTWNSGASWNREHVWPQSRQPGSASNSTRGNLGDPHALRPCNPSINSSRSNKPFGFASTFGNFGSQGSYYFPGDQDKGDTARCLFYSATRWSGNGLTLVDGFPSGNQMGDLASLLAWHYLDIPDEFERRRNHVIYSSAENPAYYTNNRNAFVDMPGAAWGVYRDNENDSQLWVGASPSANGGSALDVCVRVIDGIDPPAVSIDLNRAGQDGVYYAVTSTGDAVTDQPLTNGFTGAFPIGDATPRPILVGIHPDAVTGPGLYTGTITIDNLDMTTGLGSGFGANDANDQINVSLQSVVPSDVSFDEVNSVQTLTVDIGTAPANQTTDVIIPIFAQEIVGGYTAGAILDLDSVTSTAYPVSVDLPTGAVNAGDSANVVVSLTPSTPGPTSFVVTLASADDPGITGAGQGAFLTLTINGFVGNDCPGDINGDGYTDLGDFNLLGLNFGAVGLPFGNGESRSLGDLNDDGAIDLQDFNLLGIDFGCTP